jgi:hypothetical protein
MRIRILQNSFGSLWIRIWMRIHNTDKNSRAIFPFSLCGCGGDLLSRSYIIYVLYIHPLNFSLFAAFSFLLFVSFFLHDRVCVGIVCWPYFFRSFFLTLYCPSGLVSLEKVRLQRKSADLKKGLTPPRRAFLRPKASDTPGMPYYALDWDNQDVLNFLDP